MKPLDQSRPLTRSPNHRAPATIERLVGRVAEPGPGRFERFRHINVNKRNNMKSQIGIMTLATILCGGVYVQAADRQPTPKAEATTSAREGAVAALRAERLKL